MNCGQLINIYFFQKESHRLYQNVEIINLLSSIQKLSLLNECKTMRPVAPFWDLVHHLQVLRGRVFSSLIFAHMSFTFKPNF